ncbi:MAG: sugar ABC transporter permease [Bacilli bacterium]|nr:sugar ABC transporter permease [Bacilli bacterium]MBR1582058.1 sugar ABC transporter permease [Bacilli bacterium]
MIYTEDKFQLVDKKRHNRYKYRGQTTAYLMLLPAFVLLSIFVILPLILAIIRSFQDYNTKAFVGFSNYVYLFEMDTLFYKSFLTALLMTTIISVILLVISFGFALVLKAMDNKFGKLVKVLIYVPFFISGIIASVIFNLIFNYGGGLISSICVLLDKDPISFTNDTTLAYISIIVPTIWLGFGYNTLVMYAGLINIPEDYYQAANVDGANWFQKLWFITIPNMRNYIVLLVINMVTGYMQMMEIPMMMTGGGPLNTTLTPVLYLFNSFRDPSRPDNVTIAGAILIMIFIMAVNIFVFKTIKTRRSEDV